MLVIIFCQFGEAVLLLHQVLLPHQPYTAAAHILTTLASGIDVGPMFINFGFFSRPYSLIRDYIKVI